MDSALNRAHQQSRKADQLLRQRKFDEAIECHQKCAEFLKEAMQLTEVSQAIESLQLQYNYHINRKKVIRYKQNLLVKVRTLNRQMAQLALTEAKLNMPDDKSGCNLNRRIDSQARMAMYRYFDENDSLLRGLKSSEDGCNDGYTDLQVRILPRSDKLIIEELQMNNNQLRSIVDSMSKELEECHETVKLQKMEIDFLRRQLEHYDIDYRKSSTPNDTRFSSPLILSPNRDLSSGIYHSTPLPPLKLPDFDLNIISTPTTDDDNSNTSDEVYNSLVDIPSTPFKND